MKAVCGFVVILLFRQVTSGIVRNPPAFAKPMYSDSYLPAAMQVIFHAVEQLKLQQSQETSELTTIKSYSTSSVDPLSQSQQSTIQETLIGFTSTTMTPYEEVKDDEDDSITEETSIDMENSTEADQISEQSTQSTSSRPNEDLSYQEKPEMNEETPEANYATPETNYEASEQMHVVQEANQEVPEENHESTVPFLATETSTFVITYLETDTKIANSSNPSVEEGSVDGNKDEKKKPSVDSVVQDIYEILKPTTSQFVDEDSEISGELKSPFMFSVERLEAIEEDQDENRFTRLGEKVTQVPRPSLCSYLRRSNVRPSATLQQLANLYDSLSKDARKQGFGKYTGYSNEVLNTLETSAEGGIGPQLKKILDKLVERNELTRDDAKTRTRQAIRDLNDPASNLSKELRPLLPLRYSH